MVFENPPAEGIHKILRGSRNVAMVGLSTDERRPAYGVADYLKNHGYRIFPVHPTAERVLGEKVYRSLSEISEPIDVVDVFRKPEDCPEVAREAVEVGAGCLWMQLGVKSEAAAQIARQGGLAVVMDRCMKIEHTGMSQDSV